MPVRLLPNERVDQLYAEDIQIIQSADVFSFSLDAVLLADFVEPRKHAKIIDLCAGNGAIGLFLSQKTNGSITGFEIQERLADMGQRSIRLNQLTEQLTMKNLPIAEASTIITPDSVDLVVCNPPYFKELPTNATNPNPHLAIARHEIETNLDEVVQVASSLLKMKGKLALVHRPERLAEIILTMEKYKIVPKRLRFVYPKENKEANILLIEGIYQGNPGGLKILPPLFVYDQENNYLPEVKKILYGN